jgi:hypothetical protein
MMPALSPIYSMLSRHGIADVMQNAITGEKSLHASAFFDAGEIIHSFGAEKILQTPNYLTVQTGEEKHITLDPSFLQYVNHSCDPNVFFDTAKMEFRALKPIQPGDELLFFYPSTEWDMAQPFDCFCGSPCCLHKIQGAKYLTAEQVAKYQLTDFILEQLAKH